MTDIKMSGPKRTEIIVNEVGGPPKDQKPHDPLNPKIRTFRKFGDPIHHEPSWAQTQMGRPPTFVVGGKVRKMEGKGYIDTRKYVETNNVAQFAKQVSTPNLAKPLIAPQFKDQASYNQYLADVHKKMTPPIIKNQKEIQADKAKAMARQAHLQTPLVQAPGFGERHPDIQATKLQKKFQRLKAILVEDDTQSFATAQYGAGFQTTVNASGISTYMALNERTERTNQTKRTNKK